MPKTSSPSSHDTPLIDLLKDVGCGKLQLPAFQRGWRWDGDRICRLLASLTLGYPMGAVMLLESGAGTQFGSRLFEGVPIREEDRPKPQLLALDGQQRLTSLYRALCLKEPVLMPDEEPSPDAGLLFYLDVAKCLEPGADRLDAVVAVPGSRVLKNFREKGAVLDLSTREKEFKAGMFPLNAVFDGVQWFMGWIGQDGWAHASEREKVYDAFNSEVLGTVSRYRLPVITLPEDTPLEAVCQVFENVNRGGVVLTVFELSTAKYAGGMFDLRADWEDEIGPAVHGEGEKLPTDLMKAVDGKDFLTAVTLFASHERNAEKAAAGGESSGSSCKKSDVLALPLADYQKYKGKMVEGFRLARKFLLDERIYLQQDLPYVSQLVPLAAVCAAAGEELLANQKAAEVLSRWYWCGVLGEKYNGPIDTRFANDMDDVPRAMKAAAEGRPPVPVRTADAAFFSATRLLSMRSRNSAAYKGLMALVWKARALDLLDGTEMDAAHAIEDRPDIHHIFPKKWCLEIGDGYARANMDSIVNKTPLTPKANKFISGDAPSVYMARIRKKAGVDEADLRRRVESHLVDWNSFRADSFRPYFIARAKKLLNLIEGAMGRKVADRGSAQTVERFGASLEDEDPGPCPAPPEPPAPKPAPEDAPAAKLDVPADPRLSAYGADPEAAALYGTLEERVLALGGVSAEPLKWYVSFKADGKPFLSVSFMKARLRLILNAGVEELRDPLGLAKRTEQHRGPGGCMIDLGAETSMDAAMELVRQAFDLAKARSAAQEAEGGPARLFAAVRGRVLAFGGVERRQPDGTYDSFFAGKGRFLASVLQKDRVKLFIVMKDGRLDDPQGLTAPGNQDGERIAFVQSAAELEAAMPLVRQAYEAAAAGSAEAEKKMFADAAPEVREAWTALKERALALDGAGVFFRGGYAYFTAGGRIRLACEPQKRSLKLYLAVPEGELYDPHERAVLMKRSPCCVGDYKSFASNAADVKDLMPLVRQAFGEDPAFPKDAPAAALYAGFKERVLAFGGVRLEMRGLYVLFTAAGKLFAAADRNRTDRLAVLLRMEKKDLDDPAGLAEDVSEECKPGGCRICASSATDVDEILPLVRQSFEAALKRRESFSALTAFLPKLQAADFGTEEGRSLVGALHSAVYKYAIAHQNEPFFNYPEALEKAGVWTKDAGKSLSICDPSLLAALDGTAVMAMVWGVASHDRVFEGLFDGRVESGCMAKWLARLKEIDEAEAGDGAGGEQAASDGEPAGPAHEAMDEAEAVRLWPAVEAFAKDHGREPSAGAAEPSERRLAEALAFMRALKAQKMLEEQEAEAGNGGKPEDAPAAPFTEEALLAGASPEAAALYASLKERVLALGGVSAEPRKHYVSFRAGGRPFLSAALLKSRLRVYLNMGNVPLDDPDGLARDVSGVGTLAPGGWQADAADEAGLDALMPLIRQAYGAAPANPSETDGHGTVKIDRTAAKADEEARELGFSRAKEMGRTEDGRRVFLYVADPGCPNYGAVIGPPLFVVEAGDGELRMPSAEEEREFTLRFLKTEEEDEDGEETDYEEEIPEAAEESGTLGRGRESISAE